MASFDGKVFFKDGWDSLADGGIYYRDFELIKFLKGIEADPKLGTVVGIRFDGNKIEVIYEPYINKEVLEEDETSRYI